MRISDWSSDVCSSDLLPSFHSISISARKFSGACASGAGWGGGDEGGDSEDKGAFAGVPPSRSIRASSPGSGSPAAWTTRSSAISQASIGMARSEEHTSELQSLMRISYAVFCLKKKKRNKIHHKL